MESMLNKLKSTVSSAASSAVSNAHFIASQASNYLPGNPVTREYEASEHIASAGRGLVWKIYKGFKKSTKEEVAIFLFEKRQLDKWDRSMKDLMLDRLRKGVSQLTRLRHPQVLTVQHAMEESRDTLAFATEPVSASLANILGNHHNTPTPLPSSLTELKLSDVEMKYGLVEVSEGLAFLHNSVKIVHRNISPENIILNQQGAWKLFGFDMCVTSHSPTDEPPRWTCESYDATHPSLIEVDLDFSSPESVLGHQLSPAADMFSLGSVIHAIHNKGEPLLSYHNDFGIFKNKTQQLKNPKQISLGEVPRALHDDVRLLINMTPELRPDAHQLPKISYFDDVGVKTLAYLDQMFQWDNIQKSQFYKSLPQIMPQLHMRVQLMRIIPCLQKECVNPTMVPFVLPIMLQVAESCSKEEFETHILPSLAPVMKLTEPVQIMLQLLLKMEVLLTKTPPLAVREHILPLLQRALDEGTPQMQELCLSVLPSCAPLVEASALRNGLLPRVKRLCVTTNVLAVRVACLVCVGKMLEHLDRWQVVDDVLPLLSEVPSREAAVVMAMIGVLTVAMTHPRIGLSKETLATKVLPFLSPLSIENSLTMAQHASVMALIRDMMGRVEEEHQARLQKQDAEKAQRNALEAVMPKLDGDGTDVKKSAQSKSIEAVGGLSLEEKQRLANVQNSQSLFGNQKPLLSAEGPTPMKTANAKSMTPKTLTSPPSVANSIIASNLSGLASKQSSQPNYNIAMTQNQMTPQPFLNTQPAVQPIRPLNWGASQPFHQSSLQGSMGGPRMSMMQSGPMMAPTFNGSMPLRPSMSNGNSVTSPIKPLSSADINDFLS